MCDESLSHEPEELTVDSRNHGKVGSKVRQIQGWWHVTYHSPCYFLMLTWVAACDLSLATLFSNADTGSDNSHHLLDILS